MRTMLRIALLTVHIATGSAGLVLGPVIMRAPKEPGRHTRTGELYHWLVLAMAVIAGALAIVSWSTLWWFLPIAVGSYAFAFLGYVSAKRRRPGWLRAHITGQGGSYIALCTAFLVVNSGIGSVWAWIAPTIVGSVIITYVQREVDLGRRPKAWVTSGRTADDARAGAPAPAAGVDDLAADTGR